MVLGERGEWRLASQSSAPSLGAGPNSLAIVPEPRTAVVANYHGGDLGLLGPWPFDPKAGLVTPPLDPKRSLAHHVSVGLPSRRRLRTMPTQHRKHCTIQAVREA